MSLRPLGHLRQRLLRPSAVERAARDVARRELAEAEVDLPTWRRAVAETRDDADAHDRYVHHRAAALSRGLHAEARPLLDADRAHQSSAFVEASWIDWTTPDRQTAHRDACGEALRGALVATLLYYAAALLILAFGIWLGSQLDG